MRTATLTIAALLLATAAAWADPRADAERHAQRAATFYGNARYDLALTEYELAYGLFPHKGYLYSMARVYQSLGDPEQALAHFERSLDDNRDGVPLDSSRASAARREVAALRPIVEAITHERRGVQLLAASDFGGALQAFRRAHAAYPKPVYLARIAEAYDRQGDYEQSLTFYERARAGGLPECERGVADCVSEADVLHEIGLVRARLYEVRRHRALDERQTRRGWASAGVFWERSTDDRRSLLVEGFAAHELFAILDGHAATALRLAGGIRTSNSDRVFEGPTGDMLEQHEGSELGVVGGVDVELRAFRRANAARASIIVGVRLGWSRYDTPDGRKGNPFVRFPLLLRVSRHLRHGYHVVSLYAGITPEHGPSLRYRYTGVGDQYARQPDELIVYGTLGAAYEY